MTIKEEVLGGVHVSFPCSLRATAAHDGNKPAAEYHTATPTVHTNQSNH